MYCNAFCKVLSEFNNIRVGCETCFFESRLKTVLYSTPMLGYSTVISGATPMCMMATTSPVCMMATILPLGGAYDEAYLTLGAGGSSLPFRRLSSIECWRCHCLCVCHCPGAVRWLSPRLAESPHPAHSTQHALGNRLLLSRMALLHALSPHNAFSLPLTPPCAAFQKRRMSS